MGKVPPPTDYYPPTFFPFRDPLGRAHNTGGFTHTQSCPWRMAMPCHGQQTRLSLESMQKTEQLAPWMAWVHQVI